MAGILADILTLMQYLELFKEEHLLDSFKCPSCGLKLWRHGYYYRKADRSSSAQLYNPLPIQRCLCPHCRRTCSFLPECMAPRRWYLWELQQAALILLLSGKSIYATAKEVAPSRSTINRWLKRFKEQLHLHKDTLCKLFPDLGRLTEFADFWKVCLQQISLAQAMRLCHVDGVLIP